MIHIRPTPSRHALAKIKADTTRRLRMEIEEEQISRDLIEKRNLHIRRSRDFRQHGEWMV